MPSFVVVGASRGIGLEYIRQLVSPTSPFFDLVTYAARTYQAKRPDAVVFALVRNPAKSSHLNSAVATLKNVHVFAADVTDYRSLEVSPPYAILRAPSVHMLISYAP